MPACPLGLSSGLSLVRSPGLLGLGGFIALDNYCLQQLCLLLWLFLLEFSGFSVNVFVLHLVSLVVI